ncbi:hypothetical protein FS837_005973 [Tulasnella sp. UAMH 9824]|nr:hypothetical protein FS837_005973 [Tulasnella sp. UAMH 9824]
MRELLPPELLIDVFHFLYIDDTVYRKSKGDSSHKLLNLMLVCKAFHHIVQTTSAFWTELWLARTTRKTEEQEASWIEWIEKQITKSGELPLRVFFVLSPLSLGKIYPILIPTSPRWVHLTIAPLSISTGSTYSSDVQPLFDAPIPQLLSLSVRGLGRWMDWTFGTGSIFRHVPKLVKLEWYDRLVVLRPDDEASGNDEEYVQSQSLQGAHYEFVQHALEVLSIQGLGPPITLGSMVMPQLRFLSLGGFYRVWFFLERWQLPALDELHISSNPYYDQAGESGAPTFPALKKIEWFDTQRHPAPLHALKSSTLLAKVLAASPKLECFCLSSYNSSISKYRIARRMGAKPVGRITLFCATDGVTGAPKYCSDLRELRLQEESFEELKDLVALRPQLEIVELASLRRGPTSPSLEEDVAQLEKMRERVEVILHEWAQTSL